MSNFDEDGHGDDWIEFWCVAFIMALIVFGISAFAYFYFYFDM